MPPSASTGTTPTSGAPTAGDKQAKPEQQWLYLQDAAELTGVSEKTLRRQIKKGALKAKKGRAVNAKIQVLITPEITARISKESPSDDLEDDTSFDGVDIEEVSFEEVTEEPAGASADGVKDFSPDQDEKAKQDLAKFESMINVVMTPLVKRVEEMAVALREQDRLIEDQKRELRLLPDLQSREQEERKARELAELEKEALHKQIEALKAEQEALKTEQIELKAVAEKTAELEKQLALSNRPWWQKMFSSSEST